MHRGQPLRGWLVTDEGQIFSTLRNRLLKGHLNLSKGTGYWQVCHSTDGTKDVHAIVAETFWGIRPEGMEVCHKDGNSRNNHPSNLQYGTERQNAEDRDRHGRTARGSSIGTSKLTSEQVCSIRQEYTGRRGQKTELAKRYGVSRTMIYYIVNNEWWKSA